MNQPVLDEFEVFTQFLDDCILKKRLNFNQKNHLLTAFIENPGAGPEQKLRDFGLWSTFQEFYAQAQSKHQGIDPTFQQKMKDIIQDSLRLEEERLKKSQERDLAERDLAEQGQAERGQMERERLARERARARAKRERSARERMEREQERLTQERLAREQALAGQERLVRERAEQERAERARVEQVKKLTGLIQELQEQLPLIQSQIANVRKQQAEAMPEWEEAKAELDCRLGHLERFPENPRLLKEVDKAKERFQPADECLNLFQEQIQNLIAEENKIQQEIHKMQRQLKTPY